MSRRRRGSLFGAVALTIGMLSAAAPAAADVRPAGLGDFSFASLDVDYTLGRTDSGTSTLRVVETFVAEFPDIDQNRGMRRAIPTTYQSQPLRPHLVSITDGDGTPRPAAAEEDDGEFVMTSRADDFVHGRQTYVFTYTLEHVTASFADTNADEFYWDVTGDEWDQSFGRVTATVRMDADLQAALTGESACYEGRFGSTARCDIGTSSDASGGTRVVAASTNVLPRETMTIAVGFTRGTFAGFDAGYLASPWGWLQAGSLVLLVGALVWAILVRVRRLADEPGRPTIIAEYTPPPGIDALQSAVLLGQTTKAIPAEVLEQAIVGSIRIVEGERKLFGGTTLQAELRDPSRADGDGRMLLAGLFGDGAAPGAVFVFGRTDTRFSSAAQRILKWANGELRRAGLRRPVPGRVRSGPVLLAILAAALTVATGLAALAAFVAPAVPIVLLIAGVLLVIVVIGLVSRKPLTAAGAEVRDHLAGLRTFIRWAEADRIRMLQSPSGAERTPVNPGDPRQMLRVYEALLPYAVVFGEEREWAERIAVLYGAETPYWYVGTSGFNAAAFSAGIGTLSSTASSSSSSGGSSGGGSAGGGGGGGGGGV